MKYSTCSVALGDEADWSVVPFQRRSDYFNFSSITNWYTCENMKVNRLFANISAAATTGLDSLA